MVPGHRDQDRLEAAVRATWTGGPNTFRALVQGHGNAEGGQAAVAAFHTRAVPRRFGSRGFPVPQSRPGTGSPHWLLRLEPEDPCPGASGSEGTCDCWRVTSKTEKLARAPSATPPRSPGEPRPQGQRGSQVLGTFIPGQKAQPPPVWGAARCPALMGGGVSAPASGPSQKEALQVVPCCQGYGAVATLA